ncbi:hypothetical protein IWW36_003707 [Coemansia brasiliensis]|uniref:Uncharacterized protein n=1 Tax=Coemansia brasiliensis TaxID=2650707 RepID=A0A9W8LYP9_9FUNG|nr:hypothetical protein IWW36_003707 [Coemansia brasiliensis]
MALETMSSVFTEKESDSQDALDMAITNKFAKNAVFCLDKNCTIARDWLLYVPNQAVGWVLGSVSLVLGIAILVAIMMYRNLAFFDAVLAMFELCISLYLRAAIGRSEAHYDRMYKAAMALQYHAGIQLYHLLAAMAIRLYVHFHPLALNRQKYAIASSRIISICLAVLVIVGAVIMFDDKSGQAGIRLVQAVSFVLVGLTLALLCVVARVMALDGALHYKRHFVVIVVSVLLLAMWAAFVGSRTFVALDSPARSSEAMFTVLGFGTLIIIGAVVLGLQAPMYFNFDLASHWHK